MSFRCERCPYQRSRVIGPRGPEDSRIAVVGEAPGREELKRGKPFVGPSGKLLKAQCDEVGIDLSGVYITNSLSCMPTKNGGEKIPRSVIAGCRERLMTQLTSYPRDLVIGLGGTAFRSLSGKETPGILSARGQVFDYNSSAGSFPVLPTIHPAFVLRTGGAQLPLLTKDLRYAREIIEGRRREPGTVKWAVVEDDDEVALAIRGLKSCRLLALDIESGSLNRESPMLYVGIAWEKNKVLIFPWNIVLAHHSAFKSLFESDSIEWIFHNGQFDTSFLVREGFNIRISHDTMLAAYVLDETKGTHGLKYLAATELGSNEWVDDIRGWLSKDASFQVIPRTNIVKYLAKDADSTFQLHPILQNRIDTDRKLRRVYDTILVPGANLFREVEMHGFWLDTAASNKLRDELKDKITAVKLELIKMAREISGGRMRDYNPSSVPQTRRILYGYLRLEPIEEERRYFGGTTRRDDLERLESHPFVDTLLAYRKMTKTDGTYIRGVPAKVGSDNRLHTKFKLIGTVTGRPSSEEPNMMNIPKYDDEKPGPYDVNVKLMFGAPKGRTLIELDYSQAELRLLAALSGDEGLIEIYREGRDLHSEVAAKMFGPDFTDFERRAAKTINFGVVYGLTAAGVAKRLKISEADAQKHIDTWFAAMPRAQRYLEWCASHPMRGKPLRSPTGRLRRWGLVDESTIYKLRNQAKNAPIQVGASDFTLISATTVQPRLREEWDASVVNYIYDALVIEAPNDPVTIDEVARYVSGVMSDTPTRYVGDTVPFTVDVKVGRNWGQLEKYKLDRTKVQPV